MVAPEISESTSTASEFAAQLVADQEWFLVLDEFDHLRYVQRNYYKRQAIPAEKVFAVIIKSNTRSFPEKMVVNAHLANKLGQPVDVLSLLAVLEQKFSRLIGYLEFATVDDAVRCFANRGTELEVVEDLSQFLLVVAIGVLGQARANRLAR